MTTSVQSGVDGAQPIVPHPVPRATYRLQLNHTFGFDDAAGIVPWLAELGISHLYLSPIFTAAPGSMHGYDVVDFSSINPEMGGRAGFDRLVEVAHAHGLGILLDMVPNHMGIGNGANAWWQDVLEHGQDSPWAPFFDIDWSPITPELDGKVLLPVLGDQYGIVLERGELKLAYAGGAFVVHYWETPLPIDPSTYPMILNDVFGVVEDNIPDPADPDRLELESIVIALDRLSDLDAHAAPGIPHARYREQLVIKARLATLVDRSDKIRQGLERVLGQLNGESGNPRSYDRLDALLAAQRWRVAFWRVAAEEINYRRFFAINTLAAIRQEEPEVFRASHRLLMELLAGGAVDGLRIDHPDGLWDPEGYLRDLQAEYQAVCSLVSDGVEPASVYADNHAPTLAARRSMFREANPAGRENGNGSQPLFIVVEKILEQSESLPESWPVAGTVGYDFAQATTHLFVDSSSRREFDLLFKRFTGDAIRFPELVYRMKRQVTTEAFQSELMVLTTALNRIAERNRRSRDFTLNSQRDGLREILAAFPVYRTYTTCAGSEIEERDQRYIHEAVALARRRNPGVDPSLFAFIEQVMLLNASTGSGAGDPRREDALSDLVCNFAMKFQQLSGPVMAKGLEDSAFYQYNRLVSLNEVGGDPGRFGISPDEFHRQNRQRQRRWPHTMVSSSTHDTKRSEDVRARISVLSRDPSAWRAAINRWSRQNRKLKRKVEGVLLPHRADEYVLYQTLVGTWPLAGIRQANRTAYADRLQEYMVKVVREAGRFSNWVNPDETYEDALVSFIGGLLDLRRSARVLDDIDAFVDAHLVPGLAVALAAQVLKLTSPGIPDIYQGTESWDDSLVDPDNRRPVDFDAITACAHRYSSVDAAWAEVRDGAVKVMVTQRVLELRRSLPMLFSDGDYIPVPVDGDTSVAFVRSHGEDAVFVLVDLGDEAQQMDRCAIPEPFQDHEWVDALRDSANVEVNGGALLLRGRGASCLPVAVYVGRKRAGESLLPDSFTGRNDAGEGKTS